MTLIIETVGPVRVVTLEGKLVTEAAQDLKHEFDAFAREAPGPTLLEVSGVKYISSYLVGVFVAFRTRLAGQGASVHFAGLESRHRLVLRMSGLERLFEYHETREEGIAALASNPKPGEV